MCLGVPGRVLEVYVEEELRMAKVAFEGITRRVCLEHVPEACPGDYVLVHVGFALSKIDEAEASRILALLKDLNQLQEELGMNLADTDASPFEVDA